MSPTLSERDVGKSVENANGETIGTVAGFEDGTVHVEPSAGVMDSIRSALGWERAQEDTVLIDENAVVEIEERVIRLEEENPDGNEHDAERDESADRDERDARAAEEADRRSGPGEAIDAESETDLDRGDDTYREDAADRERETGDVAPEPGLERSNAAERDPGTRSGGQTGSTEPTDAGEPDEPGGDVPTGQNEELAGAGPSPEAGPTDAIGGERDDGKATAADESGRTAANAPGTGERDPAGARGNVDLESIAGAEDGEARGRADEHPSEETDLSDELDRRPDLESAATEQRTAETGPPTATEEVDLADELDRGADLESIAQSDDDREIDAGDDALANQSTDAEIAPGIAVDRTPSERDSDADESADSRGDDRTATDRDRGRGRSGSEIDLLLAPQRMAIEGGHRAVERAVAAQREAALGALRAQQLLGQQAFAMARATAMAPFVASSSGSERERSGPADGDRSPEGRSSEDRSGDRPPSIDEALMQYEAAHSRLLDAVERELELLDGLDSMYRRRLEDADIATLEELADADAETVADAAGVTEKRAESWVAQAES